MDEKKKTKTSKTQPAEAVIKNIGDIRWPYKRTFHWLYKKVVRLTLRCEILRKIRCNAVGQGVDSILK